MRVRGIVLFFCLGTLFASSGAAQEMTSSTGDIGRVSVNSDEAIPVGPFIFSPAVQLSWQDRDNIFFTPDDEVRDQLILARAQLLFELPIYQSYVRFSYTPQYRDYKNYTSLPTTGSTSSIWRRVSSFRVVSR